MSRPRFGTMVAALAAVLAIVSCGRGVPSPSPPVPLVLVSLDGFRWDYADRADTPALDRLAAGGVQAERLIPVFSSKTFPGHYSIVTGLYPGHHGIFSNTMRDPGWPEAFRLSARDEVQHARWWGGDPIWVRAKRAGLRAGVYFWPGSEAPIGGIRPDWWFPYDGKVSWNVRIDAALDWLTAPAGERASFVALYFEEPNDAGHDFGPEAPETEAAVRRVDAIIGRLLSGLADRGVQANVLVVSDHGMAATSKSRLIVLDAFVDLSADEIFETGVMGQIFPRPGREAVVFAALERAHPHMAVYRRGALPAGLRLFDHARVPPILLVADTGWRITTRAQLARDDGRVIAGDHGYDPGHPDMHGIFYAAGPDLARGVRLGAVEQVDLYALMCRLLGLEPAAHDGQWARVSGALGSTRRP